MPVAAAVISQAFRSPPSSFRATMAG